MDTSSRWRQVTPSQHALEAKALETLRGLLPDTDPYYTWSNFEFTDGGRIHEADALVTTPKGVFLIEIKSWSGKVSGDQGTWVQERNDGSQQSSNSPARVNTPSAPRDHHRDHRLHANGASRMAPFRPDPSIRPPEAGWRPTE